MSLTERYVRRHEANGEYESSTGHLYQSRHGWCDAAAGAELIFSHRQNDYTRETFTEGLHAHDYYELLIYTEGDVEYVSDDTLLCPDALTAVWFCPGQMHTARLRSPSHYDRFVFYFSKELFRLDGNAVPMPEFLTESSTAIAIPEPRRAELLRLLARAEAVAREQKPYAPLLLQALAWNLLDLLNAPDMHLTEGGRHVGAMAEVKAYIDRDFAEITSVEQVAKRFFYSREHLSRAFRQSFNVSVAEYLTKRRVTESLPLLATMRIADAAYAVGFHSQSAFIAAFKREMGYLPSHHGIAKNGKI